jgi:uncharacterized protein (DUF58 family)
MTPAVRVSREGLHFLALIGVIGFAAYNTRNNLLYLVLSVGIASVLVSFFSGWLSLRGLRVANAFAPDAEAGVPFAERIRLENLSRLMNAIGLHLEDQSEVPIVESRGEADFTVERLYRKRGRYREQNITARTSFPFGFFRFSRRIEAGRELTVFPRTRAIDETLLSGDHGSGGQRARIRGSGEEFYRLRSYVPGDLLHHVHWKSSAKLGQLTVRELGHDHDENYVVTFEPVGEEGADFERLVSATASLVAHLSKGEASFRFLGDGWHSRSRLVPSRVREVMAYLAVVEPRQTRGAEFIRELGKALLEGERVLYVSHSPEIPRGIGSGDHVRVLHPDELFARRSEEVQVG